VSLRKLGRYELIRVLGKGAMGVVYEARDPNLDRRVAIKTVKVESLSEEAAAEYDARFRTEARSAARLQHPNIVSVYDSDRDRDIAFLVMEYIQGEDLKHHIDRGDRYSLEQALKMVRDLLSALDYAHKQGIVHRDVKPANLLLEPSGRIKLTDFGVARIQDSGEVTRSQGSMVGTLKYMAPEQVQGLKVDARADLFSAGVVLYQLLTDRRPFDGDNEFNIIQQIIRETPPPPSSINPKLPPAIDAVVARALAKQADYRFATARDFAVALHAAIRRAEDQSVMPPVDPFKKPERGPVGSIPMNATQPGMYLVTNPGTFLMTNPGTYLVTNPGGPYLMTSPGGVTAPSAVTQEVELVYWKEVRESTDPEELQGFLARFPQGIYADLARRRLRKLGVTGDLTSTQTFTAAGMADPDATRPSSAGLRAIPEFEDLTLPSTASKPAAKPQPPAPPVNADDDEDEGTRVPVKAKQPLGLYAAIAAGVVAAAAAAFMFMGSGKQEVAPPAAATSSTPAADAQSMAARPAPQEAPVRAPNGTAARKPTPGQPATR